MGAADFAITFLEGVITFVSPCLLPMLPIYVAYFAGDAGQASTERRGAKRMGHTVLCALGFIVGFTLLFTAMGAFAGTVGSFFLRYQTALDAVCGTIVIVLGLNYLGVLRIPALQRTIKPSHDIIPRGFFSSLLFGMVFAIGWTPCVGAFLGSALSLAASSGQTATGIALLLSYSLGLGVPFFIAALLIDQLEFAFSWVKRHYGVIDKICGGVLVIVGALMATGMMGIWLRMLSV